jgi:hypothetical protein
MANHLPSGSASANCTQCTDLFATVSSPHVTSEGNICKQHLEKDNIAKPDPNNQSIKQPWWLTNSDVDVVPCTPHIMYLQQGIKNYGK